MEGKTIADAAIMAHYDVRLVILSIAIAWIAAYTALEVAGRIKASQGWARLLWLAGGVTTVGIGFWSIHFIAMLAYNLPISMTYDLPMMGGSMIVGIVAANLTLYSIGRQQMGWLEWMGGACMGCAIAAIHYTGMAAIHLGEIGHYDPLFVGLSIAIAIAASLTTLWVALPASPEEKSDSPLRRPNLRKRVSAVILGSAIAGTHYLAMAAIRFYPTHSPTNPAFYPIDKSWLAAGIGIATLLILTLTLFASLFEQQLRAETARAEALSQNEERFRSLVQNASDIIAIIAPDSTISYHSPSAERFLGYETGTLLGKKVFDLIHPDDLIKAKKLLAEALRSPAVNIATELRLRHADGRVLNFEAIVNNLLHLTSLGGIVTTCRNITERDRAEEELQRLYQQVQTLNAELEFQVQERTAQLQESVDFAAVLMRIADRVRDSLDESQILQTAVQELASVLKVDYCFAAIYDEERHTATISYEYSQAGLGSTLGQVIPMTEIPNVYTGLLSREYVESYACGSNKYLSAKLLCPIFDDQGTIAHIGVFNQTYRVFSETQIRLVQQVASQCAIAIRQARLFHASLAQVQELEKLHRLKDDFLSTISHELRSPMANIRLAIQMLEVAINRERTLQTQAASNIELGKLERYLQILHDECEREIDLINDLLDLQRLNAGNHPLEETLINLQDWIPHIVEPFEGRIHNQQQTLQVDITAALPPLVSDMFCLGRILSELLNNACKYTPPGGKITVAAHLNSDTMQLKVTNSGVEIPPDELLHVFEKFYRIPSTDPWRQGGTGLGLALVKKLTEHLGGQVWAESGASQTCFTVELPLKQTVSFDLSYV